MHHDSWLLQKIGKMCFFISCKFMWTVLYVATVMSLNQNSAFTEWIWPGFLRKKHFFFHPTKNGGWIWISAGERNPFFLALWCYFSMFVVVVFCMYIFLFAIMTCVKVTIQMFRLFSFVRPFHVFMYVMCCDFCLQNSLPLFFSIFLYVGYCACTESSTYITPILLLSLSYVLFMVTPFFLSSKLSEFSSCGRTIETKVNKRWEDAREKERKRDEKKKKKSKRNPLQFYIFIPHNPTFS